MPFVVTDKCINCKYGDCVEVCPVDCFYEGSNMLVINPDECIDCALCESECPIGAIKASDSLKDNEVEMLKINKDLSNIWSNIVEKCKPCENADSWINIPNKLKYLKK